MFMNIKFGELMSILKNDDETPFTNFKVEEITVEEKEYELYSVDY